MPTRLSSDAPEAGWSRPLVGESPGLSAVAVLIPAWQPDAGLCRLVAELLERGVGRVVVVDDGSRAACLPVFEALGAMPRVDVLRHAVNRGKGRALKTGFEHLLRAGNDLAGVVTADADGQHRPEDIVRVAERLVLAEERPVLGARGFAGEVPWRSRFGNGLTRRMFGLLTGTRLTDTQTGLRGLPRGLLASLIELPGERYEYEMRMLAALCRAGLRPVEVPIATVYLEDNRGSHFDPVRDSVRIYGVLLRSAWGVHGSGHRQLAAFSVQKS